MAFGRGTLSDVGQSTGEERQQIDDTSRSRRRASNSPQDIMHAAGVPNGGQRVRKTQNIEVVDETGLSPKSQDPVDEQLILPGRSAHRMDFLGTV